MERMLYEDANIFYCRSSLATLELKYNCFKILKRINPHVQRLHMKCLVKQRRKLKCAKQLVK